jgi:hypothetical protein
MDVSQLALHLLGAPRVAIDGQEIRIGRLLVYVAVTGQSHIHDALTTQFLPEQNTAGRATAGIAPTAIIRGPFRLDQ